MFALTHSMIPAGLTAEWIFHLLKVTWKWFPTHTQTVSLENSIRLNSPEIVSSFYYSEFRILYLFFSFFFFGRRIKNMPNKNISNDVTSNNISIDNKQNLVCENLFSFLFIIRVLKREFFPMFCQKFNDSLEMQICWWTLSIWNKKRHTLMIIWPSNRRICTRWIKINKKFEVRNENSFIKNKKSFQMRWW